MNQNCDDLKRLYEEIPVYGYGTLSELNGVYLKARDIILHVVADEKHKTMQQPVGVSSVEIDNLIRWARSAKTKKDEQSYFNKAAEQLQEDIRTTIRLLGCND